MSIAKVIKSHGISEKKNQSMSVFVSAPTGAGKSLTFELALYAFDCLFGEDCNAVVLVIVPLMSLIDQVSNLNFCDVKALYVDDCSEQLEDILNVQ